MNVSQTSGIVWDAYCDNLETMADKRKTAKSEPKCCACRDEVETIAEATEYGWVWRNGVWTCEECIADGQQERMDEYNAEWDVYSR